MLRMTAFIDTGIFVGFHNKRDEHHEVAKAIMKEVMNGRFGKIYTSDYVLNETVAFTCKKVKDTNIVLGIMNLIQNSGTIELLHVDRSIFASAKMSFEKYPDLLLTLTDWTIANMIVKFDIENLLSIDSDFDKLKSIDKFSKINRISKL